MARRASDPPDGPPGQGPPPGQGQGLKTILIEVNIQAPSDEAALRRVSYELLPYFEAWRRDKKPAAKQILFYVQGMAFVDEPTPSQVGEPLTPR